MARNQAIEDFLNREGVEWTYLAKVPLSRIDERASLANQARVGAKLNPEFVERYALAYIDGSDAPALIGWEGKAGIILADGNQRFAALRVAERDATDIYLLKSADPAVHGRIARLANINLGGWGVTREEAIEHAKYAIRHDGLTIKEASRRWRLKDHALADALKVEDTTLRLRANKIEPSGLSGSHIRALGSLSSDVVLAAATRVAQDYQISSEELVRLIPEINAERSESAQLAAIAAYQEQPGVRERREQTGRVRPGNRPPCLPKMRFLRNYGNLIRFVKEHPTLAGMGITGPNEIATLRQMNAEWSRLMARMLADG